MPSLQAAPSRHCRSSTRAYASDALRCLGALVTCAALGACSTASPSSPVQPGVGQVEIFSWWTRGGEREALDSLIGVYRQHWPKSDVVNAALLTHELTRSTLMERMASMDPPEAFQETIGTEVMSWVLFHEGGTTQNTLEPLDTLYQDEGWDKALRPELRSHVAFDGHYYAVPINLQRENNLYYNKALFASIGQAPPTTLEQFHTACTAFRAKGITPLALGAKSDADWVVRMLFESVFVATVGSAYYSDYFAGKIAANDAKLTAALGAFLDVIDCTGADSDNLGWDTAAGQVADGTAAMTIHGDWVLGLLLSLGKVPDVDFGEQVAPGTTGIFIASSDSFAVPKGLTAQRRANAFEFLRVVGSREGQAVFNPIKGSIPARTDVDPAPFGVIARHRMEAAVGDAFLCSFSCLNSTTPVLFDAIFGDMRRAYVASHNKAQAIAYAQQRLDAEYVKLAK